VDRELPHSLGGPPVAGDEPRRGAAYPPRPEPGLKDAAAAWLAARAELVRLEAREAAGVALKRGLLAALFAGMAVFAWALLMAGLIGSISAGTGFAWYWVAMIVAGMHAAVAFAAGLALSRPGTPVFETTRNELEKDRLWLEDLQRRIKS